MNNKKIRLMDVRAKEQFKELEESRRLDSCCEFEDYSSRDSDYDYFTQWQSEQSRSFWDDYDLDDYYWGNDDWYDDDSDDDDWGDDDWGDDDWYDDDSDDDDWGDDDSDDDDNLLDYDVPGSATPA